MNKLALIVAAAVASSGVFMHLDAQPAAPGACFLFGATAYPDLQTRDQWMQALDEFEKAHFNVLRVGESSWGNLETAPGQYNFGWLREYLDELARRRIQAILGTSSYNPPQWLVAKNPDMLVELQPGVRVHPMGRKSPALTHPLYREAVRRYVRALGTAFKDHPAVIGWQLDNEIDIMMDVIDYSETTERAWRGWLKKTFTTPEEFNRRLFLVSWGQKVDSLDDVPQPRQTAERHDLPALQLANLRFRRDVMLDFLLDQAQVLRQA
ncbi:MAG: beta-galactosidase, partial [Acidobacteria bacterium]|nr:beta-galactosidase [Acidobacteriota bacterium]